MADYLLEVGCEEIPARMVVEGARVLGETLLARLVAEGLTPTGVEVLGGPRRLAACVRGLAARQPDRSERIVGPPADRAFDADGKPTRAAIGFAEKVGVAVSQLERVPTPKGIVLAGTREIPGLAAAEVLARVVPEVVLAQTFPKLMRWGALDLRYVRAIRWLVSLLDDQVVPFELARVAAGRETRGHRFLGAARITLASAAGYQAALASEHVIASAAQRRAIIADELTRLAEKAGGTLEPDAGLLDEVANLVEEPHVVLCRFDASYLDLPREVLVTSLAHHQKSFAVLPPEEGGPLLPAFLAVANIPDVHGHVARGFERVLNARLADARFFWNEDRKCALAERAAKLERVVFHEKLGSLAAKTRSLAALAPWTARHYGLGAGVEAAAGAAATVAKLDLVTGMVGEFPELQGVVGGLYLEAEGAPAEVARAVYDHYLPVAFDGPVPRAGAGAALSIADKVDTLVGFFGAGLVPSGTRDPFGLRRAAQGVVRVVIAHGMRGDLTPLLSEAARLHEAHPGAPAPAVGAALPVLHAYLVERIAHALRADGTAADTADAVLAVAALDPHAAMRRAADVTRSRAGEGFDEVFTVLKRVANIAGRDGETAYEPARLALDEERVLHEQLVRTGPGVAEAIARAAYAEALERMRPLAAPLHEFFAKVLVMDKDLEVRENRLRLLRAIGRLVSPIADFSKLQVER